MTRLVTWRTPTWHKHPGVRSGEQLSFGERMADKMKAALATWTAFFGVIVGMGLWIDTGPFGDKFPYILLNLGLSAFAACQCFVLLIAAKRGERIAYEVAMSTLKKVEEINARMDSMGRREGEDGSPARGCDGGCCYH